MGGLWLGAISRTSPGDAARAWPSTCAAPSRTDSVEVPFPTQKRRSHMSDERAVTKPETEPEEYEAPSVQDLEAAYPVATAAAAALS